MPKIGRWLLLGCLVSIGALKGIPAFLDWQRHKKEQQELEKYLRTIVKYIQSEHKNYWGDTLSYKEAYAFAKDSYEASKKDTIPHEQLIALANHETHFANIITDKNLSNGMPPSYGYYSQNLSNHAIINRLRIARGDTIEDVIGEELLKHPKQQHGNATFLLRYHMNKYGVKNIDQAIHLYWNNNKWHNKRVKTKIYNIRNHLNGNGNRSKK